MGQREYRPPHNSYNQTPHNAYNQASHNSYSQVSHNTQSQVPRNAHNQVSYNQSPHNQPPRQQQQQHQQNPPRGQSQRRQNSHQPQPRPNFPATQGPPPVLSAASTSSADFLSTLRTDLQPLSRSASHVPESLSIATPLPGVPFLWPFSRYGLNFSISHPNVPAFLPHGDMSAEELRWSALQVGETAYVAAWNEAWAAASLRKEAVVRAAPELIEMLKTENTPSDALEAVMQRELAFMRNVPPAPMNAPFPANQHAPQNAPFQQPSFPPSMQTSYHQGHGQSAGQLTRSTSQASQSGGVFNFGEIPEVPPE